MLNQRIIIEKYGNAGVLMTKEEPVLCPRENEVLVNVYYAGVAYGDVMARKGVFPFQKGKTPGFDIVGEIIKIGENVTQRKIGDMVASLTITGGYTSYVNLPENMAIPVPDEVPLTQASALLLNYTTAYQVLKYHAKVKPGSIVFIQGLSGGLGNAFLDLKDLFHVTLYGTASGLKHDWVRERGGIPLDYKNDYVKEFQKQVPQGADLVVDGIGGKNYRKSYRLLSSSGHLTGIGYEGKHFTGFIGSLFRLHGMKLFSGKRKLSFYSFLIQQRKNKDRMIADISFLLNLLKEKKLNPYVHKIFSLEKASDAHQFFDERKGKGKILLTTCYDL